MDYDKNSFLAGLSVGTQLKGWATAPREQGGPWSGDCTLGDNIPSSTCGETHGLRPLDYKLVNCAVAPLHDLEEAGNICLCNDTFTYGSTTCRNLHGLLALDYSLVDVDFIYEVLWGYSVDADQ